MSDTFKSNMNYDVDTIRPSRYNGNHEHNTPRNKRVWQPKNWLTSSKEQFKITPTHMKSFILRCTIGLYTRSITQNI